MSRPLKKTGFSQGIYEESENAKERLGTMRILQDGRRFRYAKAGETLTQGNVNQVPDAVENLINESQTAKGASAGDYTIELLVTTGTAQVADELRGGFLMVNNDDTEGACYEIASNEAKATGPTALYITLVDPLKAAIAAAAEVSVHRNPWFEVIETVDRENCPAGVPLIDVTDAYYFWNQTGGVANVLCADTPAVGAFVLLGDDSGSVGQADTTNEQLTMGRVGTKLYDAGVNTEYRAVFLQIN
jgi:hypothetical protein